MEIRRQNSEVGIRNAEVGKKEGEKLGESRTELHAAQAPALRERFHKSKI
jgi:hypothetical protein